MPVSQVQLEAIPEFEIQSNLLDPDHLLFKMPNFLQAEVAELVDALDSGSSVRKDVRVRVSPSAPPHASSTIDPLTLADSN